MKNKVLITCIDCNTSQWIDEDFFHGLEDCRVCDEQTSHFINYELMEEAEYVKG